MTFTLKLLWSGKRNSRGEPLFSSRGIDAVVDYFKRRGHKGTVTYDVVRKVQKTPANL